MTDSAPTDLPQGLLALLRARSVCLLATIEPDGSPQLTETWVDTDGSHIVINTVEGFRKLANVRRDPRVAVSVLDADDPTTYYSIRGTVTGVDTTQAAEHIETLSQKYTGQSYRQFRPGPPQTRVLLTIRVDKIIHAPWG